jgi:hypothetical protein
MFVPSFCNVWLQVTVVPGARYRNHLLPKNGRPRVTVIGRQDDRLIRRASAVFAVAS